MRGYVMVLLHRGTSLARLYSIAVAPAFRGEGVARGLIAAAEGAAFAEGASFMRLEARADNEAALALYASLGYRRFGGKSGYYEDGMDAMRFEKPLRPDIQIFAGAPRIPYRRQSLAFTCGPACLQMAIAALAPAHRMTLGEEIEIWREANTIHMQDGPAGCSPFGLALAARRRGYSVRVFANEGEDFFTSSVRSARKRNLVRLAQQLFLEEMDARHIPLERHIPKVDEIAEARAAGAIPIVLISTYALDRKKVPHWVVVDAVSDRFFFVHDPDHDPRDDHASDLDRVGVPIPILDFQRMSRFGKHRQQAVLIISKPEREEVDHA